jgi:hypothetical protein
MLTQDSADLMSRVVKLVRKRTETAVLGLFDVYLKLVKIILTCDFWSGKWTCIHYDFRLAMATFRWLESTERHTTSKTDDNESYRGNAQTSHTNCKRLCASVV